jgi:pyruvate dehydrogenase E1 component alpha subunit
MVTTTATPVVISSEAKTTLTREQALEWLEQMMLIRRFEERAEEAYTQGKIGGFLHLYIGEEGVAVGTIAALHPDDDVITHYRDHGYALARGLDPKRVMAELYGKATGVSKGKGGSMHLADVSKHFWGGYAIVGGHIPLAVGIALAHQYRNEPQIVCCVFGEGATNIGMFHEGLNMAAVWKLPVIFVVENNRYGMGTAVGRASAVSNIVDKAAAYNIRALQVDGNNVEAVYEVIGEVAAHARQGEGPQFVEALTYRWRGHSMGDPQRYRSKAEVDEWKPHGPISRFQERLQLIGMASEEDFKAVEEKVEAITEQAVRFAEDSPVPDPGALYSDVLVEEG